MNKTDIVIEKDRSTVGDVEVTTAIRVPTPEHDKLALIAKESNAIGAFIDTAGYALCERHIHDKGCRNGTGVLVCGRSNGEYLPVRQPITAILAAYFQIDERKLEAEKIAPLEAIRR